MSKVDAETGVGQQPKTGQEPDVESQRVSELAAPADVTNASIPSTVPNWWRRNREDLLRDALVAVVGGAILLAVAIWFDDRRQNRAEALASQQANVAEILENTRFVRQAVMDPSIQLKPFRDMNLQEAQLSGLPLGCPEGVKPQHQGCAALWGADLRGANLSGADLTGADLRVADLTGATLWLAEMGRADLTSAILKDAQLSQVNLFGAEMSNVDLTGAKLIMADLRGVNLTEANLSGSNLRGARLSGAHLRGTDLRGANLTISNLSGADLTDSNLSGADLSGVCFDDRTRWTFGFTPPAPTCS